MNHSHISKTTKGRYLLATACMLCLLAAGRNPAMASTPSLFNVTGTGSYCSSANPAGIPVGLDGSETGVVYTISPGGAIVEGTGTAISFGNRTEGTYTISGTNSEGTTAMVGSALITKSDPVADIAATTDFATVGIPYNFADVTASGGDILWTVTGTGTGTLSGESTQNPSYLGASSGIMLCTLTVTSTSGCGTAQDQMTLYLAAADPVYWNGSVSSDWNTAGNWTPPITPDAFTNVVIPSGQSQYPDVTSDAACHDLLIQPDASLLGNARLSVSGTSQLKRTLAKGQWHYIAVPNSNTLSGTFTGNYLQTWSETTSAWSYITATDLLLSPMKGYSLWSSGSGTATYTFSGPLLSGNQSVPITLSSNGKGNDGANLLGNPYPSYLDWNTLKDIYGAVYYWNGTAYDSWNGAGVGAGSQYVAPMQGFFIVKESNMPDSFSVSDANRVNTISGKFYKSSNGMLSNSMVLQTVGESYTDKLYIAFDAGSSGGFDLQRDALKLMAYSAGVSELYSYGGDRRLSIDVRPNCQVIQLGFTNTLSGDYQLGLKDIADIPVVLLEDTKTHTYHDLQAGPYAFSYTAGESDKRFLLHLGITKVPENQKATGNVYSYQKTIYINTDAQAAATVMVYNMAGQLVATQTTTRGINEIRMQQAGNYIVKVIDRQNASVTKVNIQ